ncbi:MAG: LamG-like jellyroll fold domain-containing protein [Anaerohalosphaeraceae bacterium]
MRKLAMAGMVLVLAALTQAELVDNFQNYSVGLVNAGVTGGVWDEITNGSSAPRIAEDNGNKFMQIGLTGFTRGAFRAIKPVPDTATAVTLFAQVYYTTNSQDFSMGLTDVAAPGADFGNFEVQILSRNGADATHVAFGGRDGSAIEDYMQLELNRWYNIWAVIDQTTDSYDLYVTTDYANATEANKVNPDPVNFRNGTTADLVNFMGLVNNRNPNFRLDNIYLTQGKDMTNPVAGEPYSPSVTQVSAGAQVAATLNWKAGADGDTTSGNAVRPDIVDQYVFVGPAGDPNLYYQGKTGDPGTTNPDSQLNVNIAYDTAYRWVVVEVLPGYEKILTVGSSKLTEIDPNNIFGVAWPFTSLASVPSITTDITPSDTRADIGGTVSYKVLFFSATTPTVKWYKYVDGVSDIELNTGGDITITTAQETSGHSTTLQIANVEEADQGAYYCTIDNSAPDPAITSKQGTLFIKKLLAQYTFEQNLIDSSSNGAPAGDAIDLSLDDPNLGEGSIQYLTGDDRVEGTYALKVDGIGQYVDFSTAGFPRAIGILTSGVGGGVDEGTIVCWVKPAQIGTLLSNYNDGGSTGFRLSLAANAGTADTRMNFRGESLAGAQMEGATAQGRSARPAWDIFDGAWHLVAATWNSGGTLRIYVDGQQATSVTAGTPERYADWQRGVLLGAVRTTPADRTILGDFFGGIIDNLRVYNYELDATAFAQEYLSVTGIQPCTDPAFAANTYNYDNTGLSYCKVDLADFAVFAKNWLANGLYMGQ